MAFIALIDACVLIRAALRDTVLRPAESERFDLRIAFSWDILAEVHGNPAELTFSIHEGETGHLVRGVG